MKRQDEEREWREDWKQPSMELIELSHLTIPLHMHTMFNSVFDLSQRHLASSVLEMVNF